jgi:RNA polymerase primary sigma factor
MISQAHEHDGDRSVSLLAQDQYMREVRWVPELLREEEDELVQVVERGKLEQVKAHPDAQVEALAAAARDRLVEGFQGLVICIAHDMKHRFHGMDVMDLIQEGNCGLLRAIEENDVSKGLPLKALACSYIRYAISDAWREHNGFVRCSRQAHGELVTVLRAEASLLQERQQEPTVAELAQATGLSFTQVFEVQTFRQWVKMESIEAFQEEHEERGDEEPYRSLFEVAPFSEPRCAAVRQAVEEVLTERQRVVINLRYGLAEGAGQGMKHTEIAALFGINWEVSSRQESKAKQRLRVALAPLVNESAVCCVACGKPVPQRVFSRPRRYCHNNVCLYAARKLRKQEVA